MTCICKETGSFYLSVSIQDICGTDRKSLAWYGVFDCKGEELNINIIPNELESKTVTSKTTRVFKLTDIRFDYDLHCYTCLVDGLVTANVV